jgi:glutamate-ammonia-ligase adenylyltransferase
VHRLLSAIGFHDPAKAERNLERLEERLIPQLATPLYSLLAYSPDPDGALDLLDRYVQGTRAEDLDELGRYPTALTYLVSIFGSSASLAETFLAEPGLALQFARDHNFTKLKSKEDLTQDFARFSTTSPDHWLSSQLARFKRRNFLRIALKDILGLSTLGETALELSALADVILANVLAFCDQELEKRYGRPQYRDGQGRVAHGTFSIVSLGKLGGNELNYSSDIELLFLYSPEGETEGGNERGSKTSNKEYFVRLSEAITRTITQPTPHGQVYRVDLRLRPEGEHGDAAISVKSALEYYEHRARERELQALIKARHSAGNARLTREFLHGVEPYIYGSSTSVEAVSILRVREKTSLRARDNSAGRVDVRNHRGGIRDIEFLTQWLQRLHGSHDTWVRSGGTLLALRRLNDNGWLSDGDFARMTSTYDFLCRVEHAVQLELGEQTGSLPSEADALDRLARSVGVETGADAPPGVALLGQLHEVFGRVDEIYEKVIHPHLAPAAGNDFVLTAPGAAAPSAGLGTYASMLTILDAEAPDLAKELREFSFSDSARRNVTRLLAAAIESPQRFRLARLEGPALARAVEAAGASEYFAQHLMDHPEDLALLASVEGPRKRPSALTSEQLEMGLGNVEHPGPFLWVGEKGLEIREQMALLRRDYRARAFQLGTEDIFALSWIFSSLRRWAALAERSLASALAISNQVLGSGPGTKQSAKIELAVLAVGRLGAGEFDLASEAELLFILPSGAGQEQIAFSTRLAEKTIEVLSSYTRDGTLFAVNAGWRPRGEEADLVVAEDALLAYVAKSPGIREAIAYRNTYPVAGNLELGQRVAKQSAVLCERLASPSGQGSAEMRRLLEKAAGEPDSNSKAVSPNYEAVDLAVSFLGMRNCVTTSPGANIAEQIAALGSAGFINAEDSRALTEGAGFLRSLDHAVRLVTGQSATAMPDHWGQAEAVEDLLRRWGLVDSDQLLPGLLSDVRDKMKHVCRRLVDAE